jgi:multidrug efflux pump subunit AcrA (membrane-fusion protein)
MRLRKIAWIIGILILLLATYRIVSKVTQKHVQEERIFPVVVAAPKIGAIEYRVTLTGDIQANTQVDVRPRVTGRVQAIFVKEGDYVEKSDKLLSFGDLGRERPL